MNMHHSEEEQIENLKKWWKDNGPSVLFGVAIGLAGLFGWNAWQDHQARQAAEASALYTDLLMKMDAPTGNPRELHDLIETIRSEYDATVYAAHAGLVAAKLAVDGDDINAAIEHLQWVIKNAQEPGIEITAKLRLSRLYLGLDELDKADAVLSAQYPKAYTAVVEELRGDLQMAKGEPKIAREAYERALAASEMVPYTRQLIQNKLDQLPPSEPADV